ncbi:MAG: S8 family peptidase [Patescibacteria group bacterium]|jgi:subtilisin family serine protease
MFRFHIQQKIAIFTLAFFVLFGFSFSAFGAEAVYPDDRDFKHEYYLAQIKALTAWDIIKEAPEVVVAVIDSGVDIEHPDLYQNIWQNKGEVPGDGLDNDQNGYIDDVYGWDFIANNNDPRPKINGNYTVLGVNHGTVVAGVIGAMGNNNFGLAGVAWKIKIMPLRVMDGQGAGDSRNVYQAIKYAIAHGVQIINLSMVGGVNDPQLGEIIATAYRAGTIIVAAAGNETNSEYRDDDFSLNLSIHPQYPICHDGPSVGDNFVLGVGSVDYQDKKSNFSNFGSQCLDVVAPGENFYGTLYFSPVMPEFKKYFGGWWSGTSLAAPQVSGAAALIKSLRPDLNNKEIYQLIINNTDNLDSINPVYRGILGSGRLNLEKAIVAAQAASNVGGRLIVGSGPGFKPAVSLFDFDGILRHNFLAYDKAFKGGVSVATADLDANGLKEIITAPGPGGGPDIRIFKANGSLDRHWFAYDSKFSGGVNVAAAIFNGDAKIITVPQGKTKPLVKIFSSDGTLQKEFLAFNANFTGGVNLALADISGDNEPEIIVGSGPGQKPWVRIFSFSGKLLKEFLAYDPSYSGGVKVVGFDVYGDRRAEIIVSPQKKLSQKIKVFAPSGDLNFQWSLSGYSPQDAITVSAHNLSDTPQLLVSRVIPANAKNSLAIEFSYYDAKGKLLKNIKIPTTDNLGNINLIVK